MNKRVTVFIKYGLSILLAVLLLYYAFRNVNWDDFWSALRACRREFVILSMLFGILAICFRSLRWRELLLPIDDSTSRRTCFDATCISYVVNMVLPRVGEILRCGYVTKYSKKVKDDETGAEHHLATFDKVLGTAAMDRSADLLALLFLLVAFLAFSWSRFGSFFMEKIFGAASGSFSAGKMLALSGGLAAVIVFIGCAIHFADRWKPLAKIGAFCKGVGQGFVSCFRMKRAWLFFLLTFLIWGCYLMMCLTILWAVQGIDAALVSDSLSDAVSRIQGLGVMDALFLMLAGSLSSIVPVPGGFGAFHFIVAGAISSLYGVPFDFGMIFATLSHESQAINQMFWGAVAFVDEHVRKK